MSSDTTTQAQVNRAILLHLQTLTKEAQLQTKELKKHSRELGRNRRLISLGVAWALFLGLNLGVAAWNTLAASPAGRLLGLQEVAQEEVSRSSGALDTTPLKAGDKVGQWSVTSGFGPRSSPCPGCSSNHLGIDLNTPVGVPLFIPYDGRVSCSWSNGGGTIATLTGGGPQLRLVHLSRCTPGEFRRGERVAISGNTGSATTGPHLHYEEYSGGAPINPTRGWVEAVLGVSSSGGGGAVGGVDLDRLRVAIIGKESGGSYRAVNPDSGALGYGQVMPANLPSWSRAAIGREVSRQEFLDSPDIQIRVINHRLGLYLQEELAAGHDKDTAIRRVASRWYSGRPHLYANQRRQFYGGREYPSIDSYTRDILRRYHQG